MEQVKFGITFRFTDYCHGEINNYNYPSPPLFFCLYLLLSVGFTLILWLHILPIDYGTEYAKR